jgi:hypothetical protein
MITQKRLGLAVIEYNIEGQVETAQFMGSLDLDFNKELISQLQAGKTIENTKLNADMTLAAWFNSITEVEIADRTEVSISSNVVECIKYDTGQIKKCSIEYFLNKNEE